MNIAFLKIKLLNDFLKATQEHRQRLLDEAVVKTNNPIIQMRRFRMLSQLAEYESVTVKKIIAFESDDVLDFDNTMYQQEITAVVDRSG